MPRPIPQNWKDTWTVGIAADWQCTDSCIVRAGYKFMESPIPDETHAPTLPDADRHLLTVGAGYKNDSHSLDIAYALSLFGDRDVSTSSNPVFNGEYDLTSHLLGLSYGYTF